MKNYYAEINDDYSIQTSLGFAHTWSIERFGSLLARNAWIEKQHAMNRTARAISAQLAKRITNAPK